jgi:hypothetical protein
VELSINSRRGTADKAPGAVGVTFAKGVLEDVAELTATAAGLSAFNEANDLVDFRVVGSPTFSVRAIPLRGFEPRFPD